MSDDDTALIIAAGILRSHLVLEESDAGHDGVEVGGEEGEVEPGGRGKPDHDVEARDAHELRHAEGQEQHRHLPQVPTHVQQLAALQDRSATGRKKRRNHQNWFLPAAKLPPDSPNRR